jgi:CBS domain-containing protein
VAQKVSEIMTPAPVAVRSTRPAAEAAKVMREHGIGNVLVVDDGQLKGLVTDRDIVVRADAVVQLMRDRAVRRVPVAEGGHPVGVLSIGDMALERDERSALADISARPPGT